MPPYSCVVATTSSPGCSSSPRATAFTATVAFGTRITSADGAPTYPARRSRAAAISEGKPPLQAQELDRRALELELQPLVLLEHGPGTGPERPVVQEDDVRIEQEEVPH